MICNKLDLCYSLLLVHWKPGTMPLHYSVSCLGSWGRGFLESLRLKTSLGSMPQHSEYMLQTPNLISSTMWTRHTSTDLWSQHWAGRIKKRDQECRSPFARDCAESRGGRCMSCCPALYFMLLRQGLRNLDLGWWSSPAPLCPPLALAQLLCGCWRFEHRPSCLQGVG